MRVHTPVSGAEVKAAVADGCVVLAQVMEIADGVRQGG